MDSQITTQPQEDTSPPVFLQDDTAPTLTPDPGVADTRSQKAYIGLADVTKLTREQMHAQISSGQEQMFRQAAASNLMYQRAQKLDQDLIDARNRKGGPLDYNEAMHIINPFEVDNAHADPRGVIENQYGLKAMDLVTGTANAFLRENTYDVAARDIPVQAAEAKDTSSIILSKLEKARSMKQDVDNEIDKQGFVSWGTDQVKNLFQPYVEAKMRGLNANVGVISGGLTLGNNLRAQADQLLFLPYPQFVEQLTNITDKLKKDNPTLASNFLEYVIGTSTSERQLDNLFTIISPADYLSAGKGAKGLISSIERYNRVNTAFKQIVKEAAKASDVEVPVKAVVQEAAGDIKGAGATRAADNITKAMQGRLDPVQDIKQDFTSNFRLDGDILDSNPGKYSAGELTELKNSFYNSGSNLYDRIVNMLRVNRTPVPLASEQAIKEYQAAMRALPGNDGLLDIGSPIHMREANVYYLPHTFGNEEGRLFSDGETAYNYAINRGWADPRIASETGVVEKSPGELVGTKTDLANKARLERSIPVTQKYLEDLRYRKGAHFIGPRRAEDVKAIQEGIDTTKDILDRYQAQLEELNKKIIKTDPVIEQNGLGYKFTVMRPYKETDPIVRSWLLNDKKALSSSSLQGWDSWKNSALGWIRSADDTLAYNESLQRKVATYTQSVMKEWAKNEAKDIEAIANQSKWYQPWTWHKKLTNREQFRQFNETLKFAKSADDPKTGEKGYFFRTPGELQDHYQRYYQRDPSFQEVKAYFAHVKLLEGNRVLSEIAEFRNRARLGAEQHQIFTLAKDGTRMASGFFDGIQQHEFPGGGDQILVMGAHYGDERLYHLGANEIPGKDIARYRDLVEKGQAKIIRIYDPDNNPLSGFVRVGDERIRYVLTTNSESKPLGFNHINRRGGGHFDVDADHYVKQAKIVDELAGDALTDKRKLAKRWYVGDNTLMAMQNRVIGADVVGKMNQMNQLMREEKIDEAKELSKKLGINWDTLSGWYDPNRYLNGRKVGPYIDWNEPFYLVPRNKRIYDIDKTLEQRIGKSFADASKSGSDAKQFQVEYSQARDSEITHTIQDVGTQGNPIYKMVQADYVDPIPSLNRALNRAIRSTFMDDYKINAVEHWLSEAMPHLKAEESEVRSAPFYHFNNADYGAFKSATDPAIISNLLSNRLKINQFVGIPNKVETSIHGLTQILVDHFYNKFGPEEGRTALQKAITIVPLWALAKWQDPISGIRSFAFNAKLGVFALPQFLVQAQTFANIWALGGRAAGAGTFATMLHTWARVNASEKFLTHYDELATKLNVFGSKWKPGEWTEARNELARTGFEHVGTEYQLADDQMQHKFFKNDFGNFLDAGQVFFREGEKATRLGAYYTAFREFRDVNPLKVLTDADRQAILQKADLYTANMSRASASSLNSSIFSLPMQFLTYQVRTAEMFWGKRLGETTAERNINRARLLGFYAAMYGAPGALGVTGYPFGDMIREGAINQGYVPGDNKFSDAIMNGLISWQLALISGKGDYKKGLQYDVQGRWGTQGFTTIRESMRSDHTAWSLLGGAGTDVFRNTLGQLDPFWQFAKQLVTDDEEGNTFKVTPAHFSNLFSELSSADLITRGVYALHTGRWLAKNESYIEDVSAADVLFRELTGFKTQDQSDILAFRNIKDSEEQVQKAATKESIKDYHRGLDATRDKNYDQAQTYFANARARMLASGIPVDRRAQIFATASRGYEPQTMTSQWDWATKNVPYGSEATRLDAIQRRLQLQNYRDQP